MSQWTRSGRTPLEEKFKDPGHWHIEGWCAVKPGGLRGSWLATNGGCQVIGRVETGARHVWATTLNALRDRIREETSS